jgi:proteasome lid subunit RPN8/RPN11
MRLPNEMIDAIVSHAREDAPNECCGIVAAAGEAAVKLFPAVNAEASPFRFVIDPQELLRVHNEIEQQGWDLGAIYHSHTRSAAYPSQTDISFAASWPGVVWVIVSLEDASSPDVKAFLIEGGEVTPAELIAE